MHVVRRKTGREGEALPVLSIDTCLEALRREEEGGEAEGLLRCGATTVLV